MPQMSPIMWTLIFLSTIILLIISTIICYFNYLPSPAHNMKLKTKHNYLYSNPKINKFNNKIHLMLTKKMLNNSYLFTKNSK